jgi:hypothetical protein
MKPLKAAAYYQQSFDSKSNVQAYLGKVRKGNDEIYDTPFARGESTEQLLSGWIQQLESLKQKWPTLYEFEIDLSKKVGPMSIEKPVSQRLKDIDAYYDGILLPSTNLDSTALSSVLDEFAQIRGLRVRDVIRTTDRMKKSTNSGSPYFTKRRLVVDKTIPFTFSCRGDELYQGLPTGQFGSPAILGWRGQEGGPDADDVKQRVVWMFPFSVNIAELCVYQPLIEAAQRFNLVPAWVSMDRVDLEITELFDSKGKNDLVMCTDFTKFDQHFNPKLQEAALQLITGILSPGMTSITWLKEIFPIKYTIPLVYDIGKVRFGKHGMGSGSGGTNCDETLVHRALQYEAAHRAGAKLNPHSQCLGDDGILSYPGLTVDGVIDAYSSHGLEMNPDKQYVSTQDCTYLRRWHHKEYRIDGVCAGVYSTCRALGRLRYLERWMDPRYWDAKAVALRQLAILENVKYHPLKEEFVEYCMKRDKYRLGLDIPHFLDDLRDIAMEKINDMPDFLGYTRTLQSKGDPVGGIESWWIVKHLKSMRR